MSKHPDEFGDRMKDYEGREAKQTFMPELPIVARLDGRTFSKFTKPFERPFDDRLADAMRKTTAKLVEQSHARIGYTQSDEITLIFQDRGYGTQTFFGGRKQKLVSVLASMATIYFARFLDENLMREYQARDFACETQPTDHLIGTGLAHFDARVWQVPSRTEAANTLLWRAQDAKKNGISSACRSLYSAKQMHGKGQAEMVQMMADRGVVYCDAFHVDDRFGSYWQRRSFVTELDDETWENIPQSARDNMDRTVTRSEVKNINLGYFGAYSNREDIIFNGAKGVLTER